MHLVRIEFTFIRHIIITSIEIWLKLLLNVLRNYGKLKCTETCMSCLVFKYNCNYTIKVAV